MNSAETPEMTLVEDSVRRREPLDKFKSLVGDDAMVRVASEPVMSNGARYDPIDSQLLARLHPLPFDSHVRFHEETHAYAVWKGREFVTENLVSTTGLLKAAFPEKEESEFKRMAFGVATGLLNRLNKFNPRFTQTFFNTQAGAARLQNRNALVRRAIVDPNDEFYPHRSLLIHLLPNHNEDETNYYDELALHFLRMELIQKNETTGGYVYPVTQNFYMPHILSIWRNTTDDGTKMHAAIEWYLNRENPYETVTEHPSERDDPELRDDMIRFRRWFHRPETRETYGIPFRTELNLHYAPLNLAGQADAIFWHPERGEFSVLDWKRCRHVEKCYDDFGLRYVRMRDDDECSYEIVASRFDPRWKFAYEFGNSAVDKYLCQVEIYGFFFEKLTGKRIAKKVLIVVEPRMCEVKTYEIKNPHENVAKVCAILNARERALFQSKP